MPSADNNSLPALLMEAVKKMLEGTSTRQLGEHSVRLSAGYRGSRQGPVGPESNLEILAYLGARLPATFAAARQAIGTLADECPEFHPVTCLDIFAGPGTASWAAVDVFPSIADVSCVEQFEGFVRCGRELAAGGPTPLRQSKWLLADCRSPSGIRADLVVVSYGLNELAASELEGALGAAWESTAGMLVIVEPGTPAGYSIVAQARRLLGCLGAHIVAPCPHERECPMSGLQERWCHFQTRVPRTRVHRRIKQGELGYEDEKYSFLIVAREAHHLPRSRVVGRPRVTRAGVGIELCRFDGRLGREIIPRRDRTTFARARRLDWGDPWTPESAESTS